MTHKTLATLDELEKCAKRMCTMAGEDHGAILSYDDAFSALINSSHCETVDQYQQKLDIQDLENFVGADGANRIQKVDEWMNSAFAIAFKEKSESRTALVVFLKQYAARGNRFRFTEEIDKTGIYDHLRLALIIQHDHSMKETAKIAVRAITNTSHNTVDYFWHLAVEKALISFGSALELVLSHKHQQQTKILNEHFGEFSDQEFIDTQLYQRIVENALLGLSWFDRP